VSQKERLGEGLPDWFQQGRAASHFATTARDWLNGDFPYKLGKKITWNDLLVRQTFLRLILIFWVS